MSHLPYFKFFPADYLSDPRVQGMTLDEEGAYIRLLANMWQAKDGTCSLPDDPNVIAPMLKITKRQWKRIRTTLTEGFKAVFQVRDGRLFNARLSEEFQKARATSKAKADAARGVSKDQDTPLNVQANAEHMQEQTHQHTSAKRALFPDSQIPIVPEKREEDANASSPNGPPSAADVRAVMDHYNRVFADLWQRPLKLTDGRRTAIKARLDHFSVAQICRAMDNIRLSAYHCGDNPNGRVYATPQFICRNDDKIDEWLNAKPQKPRASPKRPDDHQMPYHRPVEVD